MLAPFLQGFAPMMYFRREVSEAAPILPFTLIHVIRCLWNAFAPSRIDSVGTMVPGVWTRFLPPGRIPYVLACRGVLP